MKKETILENSFYKDIGNVAYILYIITKNKEIDGWKSVSIASITFSVEYLKNYMTTLEMWENKYRKFNYNFNVNINKRIDVIKYLNCQFALNLSNNELNIVSLALKERNDIIHNNSKNINSISNTNEITLDDEIYNNSLSHPTIDWCYDNYEILFNIITKIINGSNVGIRKLLNPKDEFDLELYEMLKPFSIGQLSQTTLK